MLRSQSALREKSMPRRAYPTGATFCENPKISISRRRKVLGIICQWRWGAMLEEAQLMMTAASVIEHCRLLSAPALKISELVMVLGL